MAKNSWKKNIINKKKFGQGLESEEKIPPVEYTFADLSKRIIAYILDLIIVALPLGFFSTGISGLNAPNPYISLTVSSVFIFIYLFLFTWLNHGQTLGQMIMKIQVLPYLVMDWEKSTPYSDNLSVKAAMIHCLGKIHYILLIDLILGLFLKKGPQSPTRFFQDLAITVVVNKISTDKK